MASPLRPENSSEPRYRMVQREVHLRDLAAVIGRHWLIVAGLSALVGLGAYATGRNATPRYQSGLTLQITSPKQVFARLDDIDVDEFALHTDPMLSEVLVLTTQGLALEVVDDLALQLTLVDPERFRDEVMTGIQIDTAIVASGLYQLFADPQGFQLRDAGGMVIGSGTYDQPLRGPGFSFRVVPPMEPTTLDFSVVSRPAAAARVTTGLSYSVRDGTNAVDVWYSGVDRSLVPQILQSAARRLREMAVRRAREAAGARRAYIEEQLARSEAALQQSLRDLQTFKEGERISDLSAQQGDLVQTIRGLEQDRQNALFLQRSLTDAMATSDSIGVEMLNRLAAVDGLNENPALTFQIRGLLQLYDERRTLTAGALGLRASNPQITSLDERIREGHAALESAVAAMVANIETRVDALDADIRSRRRELGTFPGMETRIGQLNLETTILDETHRYLLGQHQAARMQEATIAPYIHILDGASPASRISTSLRQRVTLGILVGLLLGLTGAFFLEYLDQTVKSSADIERVLGVPVLGMIPLDSKLSPRGGSSRRSPIVAITRLEMDEPAVESYRALRTNVTFVGAEQPLQFIAVTSPGPREGKSTTAINLAVTLAQSGRRTVLIDGDLRRSTVHRAFSLNQEPGLTDVLIGRSSLAEAVRPEVAPFLDMIPSGATPPNPAELLGSSSMAALIAELRHDYEFVIMDTPPALPVTDAAVVATNADATILVVRSGDTEEVAAQRAMEQLRRVRARVAGAVLNAVSHRKDPQYSYYAYRREPEQRQGRGWLGSSRAAM